MSDNRTYRVTLTGETPLLMHKDNIAGSAKVRAWCKDPNNKKNSVAGDDRTPAWTWLTYCYEDGKRLVVDVDNLMANLRDGGAKCAAATGKGSMKRQTQSGLLVNEMGWPLLVDGAEVPWKPLEALYNVSDFEQHEEVARKLGFALFCKRARVGTSKHVRVRPRFENWSCSGTITIMDDQITLKILENILKHAGFYVGLCDWRPGSPTSPGQFGRFSVAIKAV